MLTTTDRLIRYAVLATAAGLYLLTMVFVALRLSNPSDGTRLWLRSQNTPPHTVALRPLIEQPGGLQVDDRVVGVGGRPVQDWVDAIFSRDSSHAAWRFNDSVTYTVIRGNQTVDVPVKLGRYPVETILQGNLPIVLFVVGLQLEAGWIFAFRPDHRIAQTLFLAACGAGTFSLCWYLGIDLIGLISMKGLWLFFRLITFTMMMVVCSSLLHFALILPRLYTGEAIKARRIYLVYAAPYPAYAVYLLLTYTPDTLEWLRRWDLGVLLLILVYFIIAMFAIVPDYRRQRNLQVHRHVEVLAVAFILTTFLVLAVGLLPMLMTGEPWLGWNILPLFALPIGLGLGIAVVFYRLFDIKIVIQRTLIWSALTAMVILVYIAVVGVLSIVFQLPGSPVFSLIATGIAAMLFQPLRIQLQRSVNTLIFGERDTPYKVVIRLTQKLEAALAPQAALDTIVQTISEALKLSYAAIEMCQDNDYVTAAEYGTHDSVPVNEWITFPINDGEEVVGRLIAAPRAPGEMLTLADRRLIGGLVHHAQVTIHAAQLTADLQRSREKLVTAREEERRRLRRELHDGVGPAIASLTLQIDAARSLLRSDAAKADALLLELKSQVQNAVADVRRMAYELRPPALDELGLVAALHERARQFEKAGAMVITVDAPPLPPLPAAVESAIYRIAVEAMTNAARHAHATMCNIRLTLNGCLCLEVRDNGHGLPPTHRHGVGMHSMEERAAELGGVCTIENAPQGGTQVTLSLPMRSLLIPTV